MWQWGYAAVRVMLHSCSGVTVCHRWGFVQQWLCYCVTYRELTELEKIVSLLRLRPHIDAVSTLSHSEDQVWFLCILYTGLLVLLSENCLCGKVELDRQTDRAVLGEGLDCRTVRVARSSLTDRQTEQCLEKDWIVELSVWQGRAWQTDRAVLGEGLDCRTFRVAGHYVCVDVLCVDHRLMKLHLLLKHGYWSSSGKSVSSLKDFLLCSCCICYLWQRGYVSVLVYLLVSLSVCQCYYSISYVYIFIFWKVLTWTKKQSIRFWGWWHVCVV